MFHRDQGLEEVLELHLLKKGALLAQNPDNLQPPRSPENNHQTPVAVEQGESNDNPASSVHVVDDLRSARLQEKDNVNVACTTLPLEDRVLTKRESEASESRKARGAEQVRQKTL